MPRSNFHLGVGKAGLHLAKREPRPRTDCSDIPISLERVLKEYENQFSTIAVSLTKRYHQHDTKET